MGEPLDQHPERALAAFDEALSRWDLDAAVAQLAAAVRGFTREGDVRHAAMASARLGEVFTELLGNKAAGRPWFRRAVRLLEDEPPCIEQGWVAIAELGCAVDDPVALRERADLAIDRARRFGSVDLEIKALADGGLGHVQAGDIDDGLAMLDEAMALACGGGTEDPGVVAKSVCSFFTACYHLADFERVGTWSPLLRERGLLGPAPGPQAVLRSHCDSVQGILLCHLGRWSDAEEVLERALDDIEVAMPGAAWHPPIALAELRIMQGRLAEAEALLLGRDDHMQALVPAARLHLARGDHDLARATATRGLGLLGDDRVRAATLLAVLAGAELAGGDLAAANVAVTELESRTATLGVPALRAESARARAAVRAAEGDSAAAVATLEAGLAELGRVQLPLLEALLHLDLARVLESAGDRAGAAVEARAAASGLTHLDVVLQPDDVALLDRLGAPTVERTASAGCRVAALEREGAWWTVGCDDTKVRLRDTKGLRYLAELVARPGNERHALDLVDLVEGVAPADTGLDRRRLGDAGPALDRSARETYRRQVAKLRDDIESALAIEDDDRAAALQAELDAVVGELARAFGLGGRERTASSAAEKARLNVTRALRAAVAKIVEALPGPGAVLDRGVRTGAYCLYAPEPDDPVLWIVQS